MLPAITRPIARTATAAVTALALAMGTAAPAQALGKNERNVLKGVAAALILHEILRHGQAQARPAPPPVAHPPHRPAPPAHRPAPPHKPAPPAWRPPVAQPLPPAPVRPAPPVQQDAARTAFNDYGPQARRMIQQRLAAYGYYRGAIDGAWGPGTSAAVQAYARDIRASAQLNSRGGAVTLYNGLIG